MPWGRGQTPPNLAPSKDLRAFRTWDLDLGKFGYFCCPDFPAKDGNSRRALELTNALAAVGPEMVLSGGRFLREICNFFVLLLDFRNTQRNYNLPLVDFPLRLVSFLCSCWAVVLKPKPRIYCFSTGLFSNQE